MFVDKLGIHCFMLAGHEIYYNYYEREGVYMLPIDN